MKIWKATAVVALLLAFVVLAIWGLVHFAGLQASLLWTAVIGAIAWAIRNSIEQKTEHLRLLADKKRAHYVEFLDFINRFVGQSKLPTESQHPGQGAGEATEALEEFRKWSLRLTLIGSDDVVRAWNAVRKDAAEAQGTAAGITVLKGWGNLWLAMRRDCGHADTKLKVSDVLASFVNDIDQYRQVVDDE